MNGRYSELQVGGKSTYEHRFIASKMIGRPLSKKECVHHVDGNPRNNDEDNLWIFATTKDHSRFHKGFKIEKRNGIYVSVVLFKNICPICGNTCSGKYCSRVCTCIGNRFVPRPNYDELSVLLDSMSMVKIGKMFGVSDNTIRKWKKSYKL